MLPSSSDEGLGVGDALKLRTSGSGLIVTRLLLFVLDLRLLGLRIERLAIKDVVVSDSLPMVGVAGCGVAVSGLDRLRRPVKAPCVRSAMVPVDVGKDAKISVDSLSVTSFVFVGLSSSRTG